VLPGLTYTSIGFTGELFVYRESRQFLGWLKNCRLSRTILYHGITVEGF
jgi:hypothetical protein